MGGLEGPPKPPDARSRPGAAGAALGLTLDDSGLKPIHREAEVMHADVILPRSLPAAALFLSLTRATLITPSER
jgi:hypothetical protein